MFFTDYWHYFFFFLDFFFLSFFFFLRGINPPWFNVLGGRLSLLPRPLKRVQIYECTSTICTVFFLVFQGIISSILLPSAVNNFESGFRQDSYLIAIRKRGLPVLNISRTFTYTGCKLGIRLFPCPEPTLSFINDLKNIPPFSFLFYCLDHPS